MIYINSQLVAFFLIALAVSFLSVVFLYNRLQLALLARKTKAVIEAQYERDLQEKVDEDKCLSDRSNCIAELTKKLAELTEEEDRLRLETSALLDRVK